jgi:RimJ/RimL family protein N-acetyltransferase
MTFAPDGRPLVGRTIRLDRAADGDAEELFGALDHDAVWASGYANGYRPQSPDGWREAMQSALRETRVMYVVRRLDSADLRDPTDPVEPSRGRIVGTSSLADIDVVNEKTHIGWTAYSPDVWSTSVNPECKLLMLGHAFEQCGMGRVKIQTDSINARSQAAIAKLGATREGVTRRDVKRADGSWRDSVVYSVIIDDWPAVKAGLERRLADLAATAK